MNDKSNNELDIFIVIVKDIIIFLQSCFTITGIIRFFYELYHNKEYPRNIKKRLPKEFYTVWVSLWFTFVAFLVFSQKTNPIIAWAIAYRIWEMLIINVWLYFVYGQLGRGKLSQFNVFRIFFMLTLQYFTVWIGYAVIFRTIYHLKPGVYIGVVTDTVSNWLFFSFSTLTTLGYSGIQPCQNSTIVPAVITTEVFMGIFFIVLLLGATIARLDIKFVDKKNNK